MTGNPPLDSLIFGLISAVVLPVGALIAFVWVPKKRVLAALMAFGAGALICALTMDLVNESMGKGEFWPLAAGCIAGGIFYEFCNHLLNQQGGFLRKRSTAGNFIRRKKAKELRRLLNRLGHVHFMRHLPHNQAIALLDLIEEEDLKAGDVVIEQGSSGDELFIVESGEIDLIDKGSGRVHRRLRENGIFGELTFLRNEEHTFSAVAAGESRIWLISKTRLNALLESNRKMAGIFSRYLKTHVEPGLHDNSNPGVHAAAWADLAAEHASLPTSDEIKEHHEKHANAGMAIYLGMLLDGIPESVVLGASLLGGNGVSFSLLAGIVLSNFPESLSSSVVMRENKYGKMKIMALWTSLFLISSLSAYLGNVLFAGASPSTFGFVNGVAAGAMLVMTAETMLPEAFEKGGTVVGLSTLAGFLCSVMLKVIG